jgi:acetyltransferase-like isoleucine patch superfamily enzyme
MIKIKHKKFRIRLLVASIYRKTRIFFLKLQGYDVAYNTIIERSVILDKLFPQGIHIGEYTLVAGRTIILSHDHCKRVGDNQPYLVDTYIGNKCFISVGAIILPGVHIANEVIVGAGAVVTKDIPPNCIVVGNPAKVIKSGIQMNNYAAVDNWNEEVGWINVIKHQ